MEFHCLETFPSSQVSVDVKPATLIQNGSGKRRPERFTPTEVADFIRRIDPSFDSLAARFLQEVSQTKRNLRGQRLIG